MDRLLVLARHGQSEWNLKNLFTGWKDVALTDIGIAEARAAGRKLKAQGIGFERNRCKSGGVPTTWRRRGTGRHPTSDRLTQFP